MYPGQYNTFVPNLEASGRLLVDFSRNPKNFALNKYIQTVTAPEMLGYYIKMTVEERLRITSTTLADHQWPDGADAPIGNEGTESFTFNQFQTQRYLYAAKIGKLASDQAAWDIIGQHVEIKAQQAMTARTQLVHNQISTSTFSGYTSTTTAAITGGAAWTGATTANLLIKRCLDFGIKNVLKNTGGVVRMEDLQLVVNPNLAATMAESQEMADYIKGSPDALRYIRAETGDGDQANVRFGLPSTYAGVKLVVEDAVKISTKKGATATYSFVMPDDYALLCSRPGGLVGKYGGPSFSTLTLFIYKGDDMTVETKNDVDNRNTVARVIDNCAAVVTSPVSGYLFTGAM
jgi:hypothetical protein